MARRSRWKRLDGASLRDLLRAARRHRVAAVGRRGRRHDRPAPSFQFRTRGAGLCQYRLGTIRRHLRHRHHRAYRDQCPRRCARPGLRHAALGVPAWVHADRRPAGERHSARRAGAVLVVVAWNMAEKHEIATLVRVARRCHRADGDLPADHLSRSHRGILGGFALRRPLHPPHGARTAIETAGAVAGDDRADDANGDRVPYEPRLDADPDVLVYRITGAFFFGAAATVGTVLDSIADRRKAFVVDFAAVPFLDSTAANAMSRVAARASARASGLYHRRLAERAPGAADPRGQAAECPLSRNHCAGSSGYQGFDRNADQLAPDSAEHRCRREQ